MARQPPSQLPLPRVRTLHVGVLCIALTAVTLPASGQTQARANVPAAATGGPTAPATSVPDAPRPATVDVTPTPPTQPAPDLPSSLLPRDLSPWGMFMNADKLVKAVMIGLAFASVVTWTIAVAKWLFFLLFHVTLGRPP